MTALSHENHPESPNTAGATPARCQFCPGRAFRRSRLRFSDVPSLLLMRYPVRCMLCSKRQLVTFTTAGLSVSSSVKQLKTRDRAQEWSGADPSAHVAEPHEPSLVGGSTFSPLPVRQPMTMPSLKGVTIKGVRPAEEDDPSG
jgi:hypothetical protein